MTHRIVQWGTGHGGRLALGGIVGEDADHNTGGILATGVRVLNAVPAVCAAEPGLPSTLDLPPRDGPRSDALTRSMAAHGGGVP